MSTSIHAFFKVCFGNLCFVVVVFVFVVNKCYFLKVVKFPLSKTRYLVNLRSLFSTYKIFPEQEWLIPVSTNKSKYFKGKMSSLVGLKNSYWISSKSTEFGNFWLPSSTFKVDFLNVQAFFRINLGSFVRGEF